MPAELGCPVWRTSRRRAPAALVLQVAAPAPTRPASDLASALMRPAMRMMITRSLFWTRSLRIRTPTRTRCKARWQGRGKAGRTSPKPSLVIRHGGPEMTGVGGALCLRPGGPLPLPTETLSDRSPTHSHTRSDTQMLSATLRPPVEGADDPTPAHTAPSVSPTPPTSAGTFYATQESDCTPVSSATRASSLPPSSPCTLARTRASGRSAAPSVASALPAAGT